MQNEIVLFEIKREGVVRRVSVQLDLFRLIYEGPEAKDFSRGGKFVASLNSTGQMLVIAEWLVGRMDARQDIMGLRRSLEEIALAYHSLARIEHNINQREKSEK